MWITCNDAVNRYDGNMIKVYNLDKYFRDCPNLQQGYGFTEDDESNIYIGSIQGLYIYHRTTDKFTLQKIFPDNGDALAMPFAYKDGMVWCFNKKYEIAAYHVATGKVAAIVRIPLPELPSVHIYSLTGSGFYERWPFFDKGGVIWVSGQNTLYTFSPRTKAISEIPLPGFNKTKQSFLCTFYDNQSDHVLIGTENGFWDCNAATAQTQHVTQIDGVDLGTVSAICRNQYMTVLKNSRGILFADRKYTSHLLINYTPGRVFRQYKFGFDKAQRLWMCDDGFGQVIYDFSSRLLPGLSSHAQRQHLTETADTALSVGAFAAFPNGDIIVSGASLLNHSTNKLESIDFQQPLANKTYGMATDTYRKGIWFYQLIPENHLLKIFFCDINKKLSLKYQIPASLNTGVSQCLYPLNDGRILFSSSGGLFWLKDNNKLIRAGQQPYHNSFVINPLSHARCAISYVNNDMWLVEFTGTDEIQFIKKILPGIQSFYLQEDTARHCFWAGTNKGIYQLDEHFRLLRRMDANNGLAGTYIYGLLLDDSGNVWCSHQRGLSSIDARTFQIINYDKSDGIQDWDFNNRAFYKAPDGTLYFGGMNGFNQIRPPLKNVQYYQPEVYVDEILINNKTWLPDTNANQITRLHLSPSQNIITIKSIVKDLGAGRSRELVYRLVGADNKWQHLPGNTTITFNNLAPGNYTIELGVYDKYHAKEVAQKRISLTILLPFYRELWFGVIIAIFVTAFIAGLFIHSKLNKQKIAFRQQLALEQQRNRITADLHDDIGALLSSLQINSSVASQLLHKSISEARQVLDKIERQSRDIADKIGDIIWSMKSSDQELMSVGSRISNFVYDILGATDIQYQVRIDRDVDLRLHDMTIRKNIILIAKEAINNAVKHSKATFIAIDLHVANDQLVLQIVDNGIGYSGLRTQGNGMTNMKKRATETGGILTVQTAPLKGTTIIVHMPVPICSDNG
ncbi:sensor histidine kinase [Chitinophaga varians]|uniref:sensor histidine kinase n=1 Tax=Chitinophaga varians TaxID=2202339 RepID=UPI00165EE0B1|nr:triple tyrosine motif-containing protein [Chitinophaga varians]MBC9909698.1 hypothetical protein [Chitinophaga varians]